MTTRRVLAAIAIPLMLLALASAPAAGAAGRHKPHKPPHPPKPRRCHRDKQCHGGTCNDAGTCCRKDEITCGSVCCNKLFADACCDDKCVDFAGDDHNCGACGVSCGAGKSCQDGVCTCLADEVDCNGVCANLQWDEPNCGTCGHECDADLECFLGKCQCKVLAETLCDGTCVNVKTSAENCGWCGNVCLGGQTCVDGTCRMPCGPCEDQVEDACVPKQCDSGQQCSPDDGQCHPDCAVAATIGTCQPCGPCEDQVGDTCVPKWCDSNFHCSPDDGWCHLNCNAPASKTCCDWNGHSHGCPVGEVCAGGGCCPNAFQPCESSNGSPYGSCCESPSICVQTTQGFGACCNPGFEHPSRCDPNAYEGGLPAFCCNFSSLQ